ncbi:aldose 1-epimerase family protein [Sphingobium limneticum]|nr:aldose 1-epimerase family protein [Sphingobium limneticum]MBU0930808.1 aldose 1-epimerase family protein [Alphaproteobacteria bacterium]
MPSVPFRNEQRRRQGIAAPLCDDKPYAGGPSLPESDPRFTIASSALSATIDPLGAELWSLTDGEGRALMTDADPRWWTGHAPLLFPFVGRSRGDVYRLDGQEHAMPQHGFARRKSFVPVDQDEASLTLRLEADEESHGAYPFDFRLDMAFAIEDATLRMTATVTNRGEADMPFSFGYHPAFAWPLPYGGAVEDHRIRFEKPEPAPIRKVGAEPGLIARETTPSPVDGDTLAPTYAMFDGDALIWDDLASRSLTWGVPGRPHLKIDFPDTPWLGLWQKPGAHYLCVEPWAGMADLVGFTGDVWDKQGIIRLAPGNARSFRMDVTLID